MQKIENLLASIGNATIELGQSITGVVSLLVDTLNWVFTGPFRKKAPRRESIFYQMVFAGVQSIVIVFFISLFTGIVIAMQSAYQLKQLGATIYVAPMVAISMARELGPVFTALIVAGRVGSAISAELGTMKVSEQIEALETLALDPVRFLVVPRFLALLVMLPCLTIISDIVGIIGGLIVGVFNLQLDFYRYMSFSFDMLTWKDVWTGLIKSVAFAGLISMISCYVGLSTRGGAEGVGKSTTLSVVASFIMIVIFDCILTGIFFFANV
ncbi:MAG: MlaE family lipid ABC transporter permease subunit [Candidatus Omnitrophica bacterium]|nr:MlaE family lipid ABC transporter permease subunit [Candidatus Omnitrophota bacterium]